MLSIETITMITTLTGLVLSLMIFSYLIGDNGLFRLAAYLFVGVSSGYATAATIHYVLVPKIDALSVAGIDQWILGGIPFVLGLTLFAKLSPRSASVGNLAMAVMVGVGAATAIGGAVIGTLLPQAQAAMDAMDLSNGMLRVFEGTVMLAGTVVTLASFHFSARRAPDGTVKRNAIFEWIALFGRIFIAITLGVLFAGVYMAALTAMIERLSSIINFIRQLIGL